LFGDPLADFQMYFLWRKIARDTLEKVRKTPVIIAGGCGQSS
jgi:hypothetical protein